MNYLSVEKVSKTYGEKLLFKDITFGLEKGQKSALIAKNGTGKSTLLNIIAGLETADSGQVVLRNDITVSYLPQIDDFSDDVSVLDALFDAQTPVVQAVKEYESCVILLEQAQADRQKTTDLENRLHRAIENMDRLQAWDYESKIKEILSKFGIHDVFKSIGTLSGGQRKKTALAKTLIAETDLLILDEPTNHLDIEMIEWMENYLSHANVTLLMVTHDRFFLDQVCNDILELENGNIYHYKGKYDYYLEKKAERISNENAEYAKLKSLYYKELEWVHTSPQARTSKAKARIQAFEGLKEAVSQKVEKQADSFHVEPERLGTLKVTLVASDGKESVLVQQSAGDVAVPVNTISSGSYTFLSNAFWGSSYADTKDWTVRIEYDGAKDATDTYVDTAGWVSVGSVDFTMGTIVDERVGGIHAGQVVNAHALALDSEKFTVSGKLNVEDSVYVNGGSLVIADSATVGYYSGGALDKHGALLMQSGGTMTIAGNAMFARGAYLYGGKMNLAGGTLSVGEKGLVVDGGSLVVSPKEKSSSKSVSAVNVALRSGSVTLSEGVEFLSEISQSGGTFAALDGAKAAKLSIKGGQANLGRTEFSETVQVGTTETRKVKDEETGVEMTVTDYYGGSLNIDRSVKIRKGLAVAGDGKAVVADNAVLNTAEKDSDLKKTTGVKVSDRATLQLGKNASVVGNLFVSGGNVNLLGGNEIYGISMTGGVLSATGELKTSGLHLSELGTLSVNGELVILPHTSYTPVPDPSVAVPEPKITIDSGATLAFAAQGHGVSDRLVIGEGQKLVFEDDAVVTIAYNYGDTLPFEASIIELTKEVPADEKVFGYKSAIFKVSVPNAPQYWDTDLKLQNLTFEIAQDSVGDIVLQSGLTTTGEISAHRLYYNYQTPLQTAVQKTILKNEAVSTDIVHELNNMNHVSELLTTYDKLGKNWCSKTMPSLRSRIITAIPCLLKLRSLS